MLFVWLPEKKNIFSAKLSVVVAVWTPSSTFFRGDNGIKVSALRESKPELFAQEISPVDDEKTQHIITPSVLRNASSEEEKKNMINDLGLAWLGSVCW